MRKPVKRILIRCPGFKPQTPEAHCEGCDGLLIATKMPPPISPFAFRGRYSVHIKKNRGGADDTQVLDGSCLEIMGAEEPGFLKEAEEVAV